MKVVLLVGVLFCISAALGCEVLLSPFASNVQYVGRVQPTANGQGAQFDWSAIEIHLTVNGVKKVSAQFSDNQNDYNIYLDGKFLGVLNATKTQTTYPIISGLNPSQSHQIVLGKRTEALFGVATFNGFIVETPNECSSEEPSTIKPTEEAASRRIEFIGDSISCGYGDDGHAGCHFSAGTENSFNTYGSILSRNLSAELHLECWSGKGMVRNYGDKNQLSKDPFPLYYPRTLANVATSSWNFASWVPQAVVINLGTNDFSTQPNPTAEQYKTGYFNFIAKIKAGYSSNPNLQFFLVCGPMIGNPCCQYVYQVVEQSGNNFHYVNMQGILSYPADYGCDGHPNIQGHKKMAAVALPIIKEVMGW